MYDSPKAWHSTGSSAARRRTHGDVVRAQRPERVLVGAQLAQVEPVAVDVVDLAELARVDQLLQPLQRRGGTRAGDRPSACGRARRASATTALGVRQRLGQRLLDEHVLARPRARGGRAARGWAPASPPRSRRAPGRRAARRSSRVGAGAGERRADPRELLRVAVADPAPARRRAARRSCARGSGPSSRAPRPRPTRSRRPRAAGLHHGGRPARAVSCGPHRQRHVRRAPARRWRAAPRSRSRASAPGGARGCGSSRAAPTPRSPGAAASSSARSARTT